MKLSLYIIFSIFYLVAVTNSLAYSDFCCHAFVTNSPVFNDLSSHASVTNSPVFNDLYILCFW